MTAKANHSTQLRSCPSPLVLFGIDSRGKPKAARFGKNAATLALKAARQFPRSLTSRHGCLSGECTQVARHSCRSSGAICTTS
jgi:hypothetical protein